MMKQGHTKYKCGTVSIQTIFVAGGILAGLLFGWVGLSWVSFTVKKQITADRRGEINQNMENWNRKD